MKKKFKFAAAAAVLALAVPTISHTQDETTDETTTDTAASLSKDQKIFELLVKAFDGTDATPIDPVRLALAQKVSAKLIPDGSYAKIMATMFDQILDPISDAFMGMETSTIAGWTGIDKNEIGELSEEQRKAVTAILDPGAKERAKIFFDGMMPLLNDAMSALEPAIRKGTARAYARKFSASQLTELNQFFETPTGSFFAAESYAVQADPEVMRATFQAMPLMIEKMTSSAPSIDEKLAALPDTRHLPDLNDAEIAKLAELLSVSVATLKENRKNMASAEEIDGPDGPEKADTENAFAEETGKEPWYDASNWSKADRKQETKLSNKSDILSDENDVTYEKYSQAYDAWKAAYDAAGCGLSRQI